METQIRLSRHNEFISAENIVGLFSVLSDDTFTCPVLSQRCELGVTVRIQKLNKEIKKSKIKNQKIKIKKHEVEIKLQSYKFFRS